MHKCKTYDDEQYRLNPTSNDIISLNNTFLAVVKFTTNFVAILLLMNDS